MRTELEPALADQVAGIADDHASGASVLTRQAIATLLDADRFGAEMVTATAVAICAAQPAMASLWSAAALALRPDDLLALRRFSRQVERAPRALARVFVDQMLAGRPAPAGTRSSMVVATVSASESVRSCLEALSAETTLRVICPEARPLYEGRRLAAQLAEAGIPTTVCTDAALAEVMDAASPIEAVVTGADAVSPRWFMNKCGTRCLASAAVAAGTQTYVLASRDKFIDTRLADRLRANHGPSPEVWSDAPSGVTVANPYFERVPLDSAAAFVTDAGSVGTGSVQDVCASVVPAEDVERLAALLRAELI